ncbi:uncharacterized protein LOC117640427 [Thrips palmi]|uniref:Uncharacterized protein LOC117640427 n=1 Tax=Thrips palmi TaxID=161013 RepID=A0A6P8Y064_THRPL|nr:uncharacterized protein LOC117640427 [Thrips palmi]
MPSVDFCLLVGNHWASVSGHWSKCPEVNARVRRRKQRAGPKPTSGAEKNGPRRRPSNTGRTRRREYGVTELQKEKRLLPSAAPRQPTTSDVPGSGRRRTRGQFAPR